LKNIYLKDITFPKTFNFSGSTNTFDKEWNPT